MQFQPAYIEVERYVAFVGGRWTPIEVSCEGRTMSGPIRVAVVGSGPEPTMPEVVAQRVICARDVRWFDARDGVAAEYYAATLRHRWGVQ